MIDQLLTETIPALHPDSLCAEQATQTLRYLMRHYANEHPPRHWATMVSDPQWRHHRHEMVRQAAEAWLEAEDVSERDALLLAELHVMSIEAVAGLWQPEQCRLTTVWMNGKPRVSLVCTAEGFTT